MAQDLRSRKILYDEYSKRLYFESKIESLRRICEEHARVANANNKCEENKMRQKHKKATEAYRIFDMKMKREKHDAVEGLLDKTAHYMVLDNIGRVNEENTAWNDNYGRYGQAKSRLALQPRINSCKKKLEGPYIRRKEAHNLLKKRRAMPVLDRSLDTLTLMRQWTRGNLLSPGNGDVLSRSPLPVLPPIETSEDNVLTGRLETRTEGSSTESPDRSTASNYQRQQTITDDNSAHLDERHDVAKSDAADKKDGAKTDHQSPPETDHQKTDHHPSVKSSVSPAATQHHHATRTTSPGSTTLKTQNKAHFSRQTDAKDDETLHTKHHAAAKNPVIEKPASNEAETMIDSKPPRDDDLTEQTRVVVAPHSRETTTLITADEQQNVDNNEDGNANEATKRVRFDNSANFFMTQDSDL